MFVVRAERHSENALSNRKVHAVRREVPVQVVHSRIVSGVVVAAARFPDPDDVRQVWSRLPSGNGKSQSQQTVSQPGGQRPDMAFDPIDPDRRNQFEGCFRGPRAEIVVVPQIEPPRAGGVRKIVASATCRLPRLGPQVHAVPGHMSRNEGLGKGAPDVQETDPVQGEHALLGCHRECVHSEFVDVATKGAHRLGRIQQDHCSMGMRRVGHHAHVRDETRRKRHVRDRHQSRSLVHRGRERVRRDPPAIRFHGADVDTAELSQVVPQEDVVRVLEIGTQNHVLSRFPGQARREQVQGLGYVLGDRHLVGLRPEEPRHQLSAVFNRRLERRLVTRSQQAFIDMSPGGVRRGLGKESAHRHVQVGLVFDSGEQRPDIRRKKRRGMLRHAVSAAAVPTSEWATIAVPTMSPMTFVVVLPMSTNR